MIFLVLPGKIIFLFPKNTIWHLRRKLKDDLPQRNTRNIVLIIIFFKFFFKDNLFKKCRGMITLGHDLPCIIWKHGIFFPENMIFFPWAWEISFLKKYMEIWYFLCTRTGVTNLMSRPSAKKNQRWSYPAKINLKVIDVLGWHPRNSSSNSLYFLSWRLYRRFHILLSSEKKQEA